MDPSEQQIHFLIMHFNTEDRTMIGPFDDEHEDTEPTRRFVNGEWVDLEDLPIGYGNSPDWWDDDGFGETFEEYMEHTD